MAVWPLKGEKIGKRVILKSRFTAKRRILQKNVITTTPPFMTILPTRDTFETPIVNMLDVKSVLIYFHHATSIFWAFFRHGLEIMVTEKKNFA